MESTISLNEAAERLGVHYMTAYRYVRTGRLRASKRGGEWRVPESSIEAFTVATPIGEGRIARHDRLEERLLASDEPGAWEIVEGALASGLEPREVHLTVITPALVEIGRRWEHGQLSIAEEHRATAVTTRIIGRLGPLFNRPGRRRGTIVVGAPASDQHALPSAMAADLLRERGFSVIDLGANAPAESFLDAAASDDEVFVIGVSVTTTDNEHVESTIRAIRAGSDLPIVVGGTAMPDPELARGWGATTISASPDELLAVVDALADQRPRRTAGSAAD